MMRWVGAGLVVLALAGWMLVRSQAGPEAPQGGAIVPRAAAAPQAQSRVNAPVPAAQPVPLPAPESAPAAAVDAPRSERLLATGEPLSVTGRVLDAAGAPLPGADVWFLPAGQLLHEAGYPTTTVIPFIGLGRQSPALVSDVPLADLPHAVTGADGAFTLAGPDRLQGEWGPDPYAAPGAPHIIARSEGYAVRLQQVGFGGERKMMTPNLRLCRAGAVAGRVVDEAGRPVAGVAVRLTDSMPRHDEERDLWYWPDASIAELQATATDEGGAFSLGGLWPGTVELEFVLAGHAKAWRGELAIAEDTVTQAGDVVLPRGATIEGRVADATGQPIVGARVFATAREVTQTGRGCVIQTFDEGDDSLPFELEAEWWQSTCGATSDAAGHFRIEGLLEPTLTLYARADGFEAVRLRDVSAGTRDAAFTLQPEAFLDVHVVEADSKRPVADASVTGRRRAGEGHDDVALRVERVQDGCRVHGVGPVGTRLIVSAPGCSKRSIDLPGQKPGTRTDTTVELTVESFVGGRITSSADGAPIAEARAVLAPVGAPRGTASIEVRSGADGAYRFTGLSANRWTLHVYAPGFARSRVREFACGAGERRASEDVVLDPGATLDGTVHQLGIADGPRYRVTVKRAGSAKDEADSHFEWSEADGTFHFEELAAGEQLVEVEDVGTKSVTLAPGERGVVAFGAQLPRVTARLMSGGVPCAGLLVELRKEGESWATGEKAGPSDADGLISLLIPTPGEYELKALVRHGSDTFGPVGSSEPFPIAWGEQRPVDVALGTGRIAGVVLSPDGPFEGEDLWIQGDDDGLGLVTTDAAGRFVIDRLPGGSYSIQSNGRCEHRAHRGVSAVTVELAEGAVRDDVTLRVSWGASVKGTVHASAGVLAPESAVVYLVPEGEPQQAHRVNVESGAYEAQALEPGAWRACAHRSGDWSPGHECTAGLPLTVKEGDALSLDLVLQPGS